MSTRRLTKGEQKYLAALNSAVAAVIKERRDWLDRKMYECSTLKIGDDIYDLDSGQRLGKVHKLYRYWRDRDEGVRDTSMDCHYEYETSPRSFDNTSRQSGRSFGTREQALQQAEERAAWLRNHEPGLGA